MPSSRLRVRLYWAASASAAGCSAPLRQQGCTPPGVAHSQRLPQSAQEMLPQARTADPRAAPARPLTDDAARAQLLRSRRRPAVRGPEPRPQAGCRPGCPCRRHVRVQRQRQPSRTARLAAPAPRPSPSRALRPHPAYAPTCVNVADPALCQHAAADTTTVYSVVGYLTQSLWS